MTNASIRQPQLSSSSSTQDNTDSNRELLDIVTKNISEIIAKFNVNHKNNYEIPEKLWTMQPTDHSLISSQVTPDQMTTLKHDLDRSDDFKNFKNKFKPLSTTSLSSNLEQFNEFVTRIIEQELQFKSTTTTTPIETTTSMPTLPMEFSENDTKAFIQIFNSLRANKEDTEQTNTTPIAEIIPNSETGFHKIHPVLYIPESINQTKYFQKIHTLTPVNESKSFNEDEEQEIDKIIEYYLNNMTASKTNAELAFSQVPRPMKLDDGNDRIGVDDRGDENDSLASRLISEEMIDEDGNGLTYQKAIETAAEYGLEMMNDLYLVQEPKLYKMGLWLEHDNPARYVAAFSRQREEAKIFAKYGYASLQASSKLAEQLVNAKSRETPAEVFARTRSTLKNTPLHDLCPLRGVPRCSPASQRYRTADGTCNNALDPRRGSSLMPLMRFLKPQYDDGIQSVRRSVVGNQKLPSPRLISSTIHTDRYVELSAVTTLLMQWGQFLDHDITQSAQSRGFNGSVPRCCRNGGRDFQPNDLLHVDCLPIEVPSNDWFLAPHSIRCMEFVRSAPTSRVDCALGWREQINQVTSFIDGSNIYGSSVRQADSLRTFRNGMLAYATTNLPPSREESELCNRGAISSMCFRAGDNRVSEQPGLTAMHIVWIRQHNLLAQSLAQINSHWSDEKIYQETRRIIGAMIQHITYREFLPVILGPEVIELFDLQVLRKGYYDKYDVNRDPSPANEFSTAAYRFGHSLVQHSFIRADSNHRPIFNNVSLHDEHTNPINIWDSGSVDRILLGMCNQPTQRRDEFITEELTNRLFQTGRFPFGMDLASINIQRGRDHGIPSYTAWREPCGLDSVTTWSDLAPIISSEETLFRLKSVYQHVDDIDLFTGGLAEKPVRRGLVGPTFACIIAQQFSNLRRGDRFWYENGDFESSFTLPQLQQIRKVTLAQTLCQTMDHIKTLQPFAFLTPDNFRNERVKCTELVLNSFELNPWLEVRDNIIKKSPIKEKMENKNQPNDEIVSLPQDLLVTIEETVQTNDNFNAKSSLLTNSSDLKSQAKIDQKTDRDDNYEVIELLDETNNKPHAEKLTIFTKKPPQLPDKHGYGSEDWYDEFPDPSRFKMTSRPSQNDFLNTTTTKYGIQTFQSIITNPTRRPYRPRPVVSNQDRLDLHYDGTQTYPRPNYPMNDLTYLIGIVQKDSTTPRTYHDETFRPTYQNRPTNDYINNYNKPNDYSKPNDYNKPNDYSKPNDYNKPNDYYKPTDYNRPNDFYNQNFATTKRYTVKPQNSYYDSYYTRPPYTTRRPKPPNYQSFDDSNFDSGYGASNNRPVQDPIHPYPLQRPIFDSPYNPSGSLYYPRPGLALDSNYGLAMDSKVTKRPEWTNIRQPDKNDLVESIYGDSSKPMKPSKPRPIPNDSENNPNYYNSQQKNKPTTKRPKVTTTTRKSHVKLFYIGNVLHKIREDGPTNEDISDKDKHYVKIASTFGHYHNDSTRHTTFRTKQNLNNKNKEQDDLEDLEMVESNSHHFLVKFNETNKTR